jgi:uncharacterized protein (TIGR00251 family)
MHILENKTRISVRVQPNAAKNEVAGLTDNVLCIRLAAPPVKGKANRELVAFLSRLLGIKKDGINIIRGHTARNKVIVIDGLSREHALELLLRD